MAERIVGVSRSSLWLAWKEIRGELRNATVRDVVDLLDYDIEPEVWIRRLLRQLSSGAYEPHIPLRFPVAKSSGFKRVLTFPAIPDLVLYRAIADYVHKKARKYQQPHVYYRRGDIARAAAAAERAAEREIQTLAADYRFTSTRSFLNWLNYAQYRKHLILENVYPFLVVTDITNFFDSVLHSQVSSAFRSFPIPSRLIGLLFFLLERLAIRADYSDSPGIGLPVDEFECSRSIANLVLFAHDRRIVERVGKDAYVRWMDDQVIGVGSRGEGLRLLRALQESLSALYLTPNAKKSHVLSIGDAKVYFHLDANGALDALERRIAKRLAHKRALARELGRAWRLALRDEGKGQWDQIVKRAHRLAGLTRARFLRRRATTDILHNPAIAERIADYMRCSGSASEYLRFLDTVLSHGEHVHDDVELVLTEGLLRLEASGVNARLILQRAATLIREVTAGKRTELLAAPASLLVLRFGDRRHASALRRAFRAAARGVPPHVIRTTAIAYASYGKREFRYVRREAAALLLNPLALTVRLVARISKFTEVPDRYKARLTLRRDPVRGRAYLERMMFLGNELQRRR